MDKDVKHRSLSVVCGRFNPWFNGLMDKDLDLASMMPINGMFQPLV